MTDCPTCDWFDRQIAAGRDGLDGKLRVNLYAQRDEHKRKYHPETPESQRHRAKRLDDAVEELP